MVGGCGESRMVHHCTLTQNGHGVYTQLKQTLRDQGRVQGAQTIQGMLHEMSKMRDGQNWHEHKRVHDYISLKMFARHLMASPLI